MATESVHKLTFHGQSCFTLETDKHKAIIDPFLAPGNPKAKISADDISEMDFVLISHGHGDHIADAVPIAKKTRATCISNFEIQGWLLEQGVENAHPMHLGGGHQFDFAHIKLTIAHHASTLPDGTPGGNPAGFIITLKNGYKIYFAGDTALTYDMKLIGDAGGVDLAILPIGDNFTMGPDDAVLAAQFCKARHVIPCHYNTWPLIEQDAGKFVATLNKCGIQSTILEVGQSYSLKMD